MALAIFRTLSASSSTGGIRARDNAGRPLLSFKLRKPLLANLESQKPNPLQQLQGLSPFETWPQA